MSNRVQSVVVGAGVVGLAVARALALSRRRSEVLILEASNAYGMGISSRNSEVIHAGLYYPKTYLKTKLCVRGRKLLYQYLAERGDDLIPHRKCGKLIVATEPSQQHRIDQIFEQGKKNGVNGLQIIETNYEIRSYEPALGYNVCRALHSSETGIVDSHSLMTSLLADAQSQSDVDVSLALKSTVSLIDLDCESNNISVTMEDGTTLICDEVINAAGLFSAGLATQTLPQQHYYRHYYAKGNYFKLQGCMSPFDKLIYPLPSPQGGLGVHATLDLNRLCKFGPDVEWLDKSIEKPEDIDFDVNIQRSNAFYDEIRKYWPDLEDGALVSDYAGVRPKLSHPDLEFVDKSKGGLMTDFMIVDERKHKIPGLVHLLGIESPGLTSSMAIAEYVVQILHNQ